MRYIKFGVRSSEFGFRIIMLIMLFLPLAYALSPNSTNIDMYYRFDGNLSDASSHAITATLKTGSTTYSPGKLGSAINLSGANAFLSTKAAAYNYNEIKVMEFWIYLDSVPHNGVPFTFDYADEPQTTFYILPAGKFHVIMDPDAGVDTWSWSTGIWNHIVLFPNYGGRLLIFNNSKIVYNGSSTSPIKDRTALAIGGYLGTNDLVHGKLDNLILFNSTPSNSTIQQWVDDAYNSGAGRDPIAPAAAQVISNSSWNVTNYIDLISNSTAWNSNSYINVSANNLTATFSLNIGANATCSIHNLNYTDMKAKNSNYALLSNAVPLPTAHSFLFYDNLSAYNSTTCIYCAYYNGGSLTASSGCLKTMFSDIKPPDNIFISQVPSDLRDTNVFGSGLSIRYGITDESEIKTAHMTAYTNSSGENAQSCIRDICSLSNFSINPLSNLTGVYLWNISDNLIYNPAVYNIRQDYMQNTFHSVLSTNNAIKIDFTQIKNSYQYNFIEVMSNGVSGINTFYYCNSSYTSGLYASSPNCASFAVLNFSIPYNHTHSSFSSHKLIPFPVNSGYIGGIAVTNISYIIMKGDAAWNYSYITNITNTFSTSNNNGNTWNAVAGTLDAHIHQFSDDEKLCYNIFSSDIYNNINSSPLRCDNIGISRFPPTNPDVFLPNSSTYAGIIPINYTAAIPFSLSDTKIVYYDIELFTADDVFFSHIGNNSLELSLIYDISSVADGDYKIYVTAYDNNSFSSLGISEIFTIDNPFFNISIISPVFGSWFMLKDTIYLESICFSDFEVIKTNVSIYDSGNNQVFGFTNSGFSVNTSYVFADDLISDIYTAKFTCVDIIGNTISNIIAFPVYYYFNLDMFQPPDDITYFWVKTEFDTYEVITGFNITLGAICSDYIDGIFQGESYIDPFVLVYNSYVLPIGTYNLSRFCYVPDTYLAQTRYKIAHISVAKIPECTALSISTPYFNENITITLNTSSDERIDWLMLTFNGTERYNMTVNESSIYRIDSIKNKVWINETFSYGYNFSDYLGNTGGCFSNAESIERPAPVLKLFAFNQCPSTTEQLIFMIFVFILAALLIMMGFFGASTLGVLGAVILLFFSFSIIACDMLIGIIMILISLLIALGFILRMLK